MTLVKHMKNFKNTPKANPVALVSSVAMVALLSACSPKNATTPATDTAASTPAAAVSSTPAVAAPVASAPVASASDTAPASAAATVVPAVTPAATSSTTTTTTTTKQVTKATPSPLALELIAFNQGITSAAQKSQVTQDAFIQKHKDDKSPDVQLQFMKEGIKSLDQQKADLQAIKLTDPRVMAIRDKFIKTIDLQKTAYTTMVNTPKPTKAQQEEEVKQMAQVQKTGMDAQNDFVKLATEAGLQPKATAPAAPAKAK